MSNTFEQSLRTKAENYKIPSVFNPGTMVLTFEPTDSYKRFLIKEILALEIMIVNLLEKISDNDVFPFKSRTLIS